MALNLYLTNFISEINHPAPVYFQRRANDWLRQVRELAHKSVLLPATFAGVSLDYLDILRAELNVKNGIALSHLEIAQKILEKHADKEIVIEELAAYNSVTELAQLIPDGRKRIKSTPWLPLLLPKVRFLAYKARQEIRQKSYLKTKFNFPSHQAERRLFVLSRHLSHLKDILPVVSYLKDRHNVQTLFGVVTDELAEVCKTAGYDAVNLTYLSFDSTLKQQSKQEYSRLYEFISKLEGKHFTHQFTDAEMIAMNKSTRHILRDNLFYSMRIVEGVKRVFEEFRPSLFFANNPYATEGRAATYVAKKFNVPTASSEHGSIFPNDPIWQECLVDLVCVFGEPSRRALLSCDVMPEQIAVTGSPHFDKIFKSFQKQDSREEAANILVATSGPGDQVSLEQHQRFINILYEASTLSPDVRWVVKLHTKDREDLYTDVAQNFPSSRVEIISSERTRFGTDIFDYLATARALVTICSTSAMDAMLVSVPVITVALESKEKGLKGIEFLERGCTLRVERAEELAEAVQMVWKGIRDEQADAAAREYINEHYSNFGNATENVAERLLNLMETNKNERRYSYH